MADPKSRYPGPKPFTDKDKDLFFGREQEKEALINLIKTKGLSIIFGRSGNGKSSLIHAALVPYFETERYKIVELRLQPFKVSESKRFLLKNQIIGELKKSQESNNIYLSEILPEDNETSLWQYFKTSQWEANKKGFEGIIFIIDQFEELFNFQADQYKQFAKEFSEVVYNRIPYRFQEALNERIKTGDAFIVENKYKIDFLRGDFFSSFLIGIRSDRLYLLDELGDVIPIIFNNRFRLDHLDSTKLDEAIIRPASLIGNFTSPPFEIDNEIVNEIKNYLFEGVASTQMGYIETFQLQIICGFIERRAMEIKPVDG
ncbi:MAG: nSTAND1 domain-containing NTPase, partial [Mucilaginibacter sp.]